MDIKRICSICGKTLAASAPEGLCPECLLKAGLGTGVDLGVDTETSAKQAPFNPPAITELAPLFPQLEIFELIGKGGMGAVYRARQKELDRIVALKILPPDIGRDPAFAERFAREAKALAKLNHPGIVTIHDFGRANGLYFFLMEFMDGMNLRQLLNAGRVSPREALAIVPQICDALQFAHDQGIVHRDIKPENILLDRRGRVKIADFGLVKLIGAGNEPAAEGAAAAGPPALTESGKIVGTPNYMAPEQAAHPGEVDHRVDIYALGVVFYQMLTGELPGQKIQPPSQKVQIDVRLDEVVLRALEKRPELRYQQASLLKTQVETITNSTRSQSGPPVNMPAARPQWKLATLLFNPFAYCNGGRALFVGLAAVLLTGLLGAWSNTYFDGVLDTHSGAPAPLWCFLAEGIADWLCLATVLWIFGKIFSTEPFRLIDLLGTQALARWPAIFVSLLMLPGTFQRFANSLVEQFRLSGQAAFNAPGAVFFFAVIALMLPLICWMVRLMYKSYSASCKLAVGKAVGTFIPAILLAEVLSKWVIYLLLKLV